MSKALRYGTIVGHHYFTFETVERRSQVTGSCKCPRISWLLSNSTVTGN